MLNRLCPHDEIHDRIRNALGYCREARDGNRSVCALCWAENINAPDRLFHSPHGSILCMVWAIVYTADGGFLTDEQENP